MTSHSAPKSYAALMSYTSRRRINFYGHFRRAAYKWWQTVEGRKRGKCTKERETCKLAEGHANAPHCYELLDTQGEK